MLTSLPPAEDAAAPDAVLRAPATAADWHAAAAVLREYLDTIADTVCLQDGYAECAAVATLYAPPRAHFLLAWVDEQVAGCCALRPLDEADYIGAAEMRRLFVRPAFRGLGLGRQLTEAILDVARQEGYQCVLLDTLNTMEVARELYEELGFEEIAPYYDSPLPGAHYLKVDL